MKENPDSKLWELAEGDINKVNGRIPYDAMRMGDQMNMSTIWATVWQAALIFSSRKSSVLAAALAKKERLC